MVKVITEKKNTIKLVRNNKIIERSLADYQANKNLYNFRGFKPYEDDVKVEKVEDKVVSLKPKRKTRKKKDEQVDLETN
jgi:hypothetical protein